MSIRRTLAAGGLTLALIGIIFTYAWAADPPTAGWKDVRDAINKGLPKTAIEHLNPIIERAVREKKYAEAIRAIGMKIAMEGNIQGNKPEEKIIRMREEIKNAPGEMKPVMNALLANWFWHYFQQNRWRFMQRTQTAGPPSDDFTTWDLSRILSEIDKQFQATLADAELLKQVPVADYDDLLEKGNAPDAYRPTLYDVLAHNALGFYAAGEQAGSRSLDAFDLSAEGPIFASAAEFIKWEPDTSDKTSPTLKAIKIFQDVLRFHEDDDRSAFLDTDLARLEFGNNKAFGEEKTARFKAALKRFSDENSDHEISSRGLHVLATAVHGEGDWVKAREIAQQGQQRFPNSVGGRRCFNLIAQIEAPSSAINTERVWNDPLPTIDVRYRNLTKIYLRLVPFDFDQFVIGANRYLPESLNGNERKALLRRRAVHAWSADLPATEDYQERTESLPAPDDIEPGSYFVIASHNKEFNDNDNHVSFSEVWISDLALITRNHQGKGVLGGFVLDAKSGQPRVGASVRGWYRDNRNNRVAIPAVKTDKNGLFRFKGLGQRNRNRILLHASHQGHELSSANYLYNYQNNPVKRNERTQFFTDRTLYRPGQSIHYKGICMVIDHDKDDYETIAGRNITLGFFDVNNKEIERVNHRTNDYGSFSGTVTAPRDRLMGQMYLRIIGGPNGQTQVRVEEYKRPKFRVEMERPKEAAKLGGIVKLQGKATAYTGAAIDGAKVSWRVVRNVQYPVWWYWRFWYMQPRGGASQEIAHGVVQTESNGTFDLQFTAKPDKSIAETSEPTFRFTIYADVTDSTGETRSAQQVVNVGYTALAASLSTGDWLTDNDPISIAVRTTTLDGEGQKAKGTLKVYSLKQPKKITRAPLTGRRYYWRGSINNPPPADPTNPNSWDLDEVVFEKVIETDDAGNATTELNLEQGIYRAKFETQDRFGKTVSAVLPMQVLDPEANKLKLKIPNLFAMEKTTVEPGDEFSFLWGSGYNKARAFVEVEHRGKLLQSFWTDPKNTQVIIEQDISEEMRGGFTVRTTMVRENRAYLSSRRINVPWTNKNLEIKWEHFVSKLEPASKERWTAIITGPDAKKKAAEMVATMYDASLDAYQPHNWPGRFGVYRNDYSVIQSQFQNLPKYLQRIHGNWSVPSRDGRLQYRQFPSELIQNFYGYGYFGRNRRANKAMEGLAVDAEESFDAPAHAAAQLSANATEAKRMRSDKNGMANNKGGVGDTPDLDNVSARKNLNETAFFFPHLVAGDDGSVRLEFSMPEALTEWKFMGFAHDNELRGGLLTSKTVTAKDLMVQPNPPRFVREGDLLEFTVKVSNQSPTRQTGTLRLSFGDARTGDSRDKQLGNADRDQSFEIAAGESKSLSWRINVPDDIGFLTYKAVGSTGRLSDGEEGYLPVLSRRILITESLPLPIRGKQTKTYQFAKLSDSGKSNTLKHQSLTVQMVSNPSWYAVMALPYLMEYPHTCSEQTFNRLYANSLARHIAGSDPKIHRVFQQWRNTPALDSPMAKNQDLKAVMIEETPWLRQAEKESQARRNVGLLFDDNRMDEEKRRLVHQLTQMQFPDGAWPWFPGGPANDYITLYITTGFGRLRHLGVDVDMNPAIKSINRLDNWAKARYDALKPSSRHLNHMSSLMALYLYGRSFYLEDKPVPDSHREAVNYWRSQAKTYWLEVANRQSQAHIAVAMKRFGEIKFAKSVMKSIKERSVSNEEMGMFWRDLELSWWWFRAPIETQAMMIEAFDEVVDDAEAVEDCKVWLLKQKQTQDWKTTKATADAVYALLLRGTDVLSSDALVEVDLGGELIKPQDIEAGTGFYEHRFVGPEIKPSQGEITLTKVDDGVAWGSLHWQYLEDISKVTPHEGTPLTLKKQLFVKKHTDDGPTLVAVDGPVSVGDELVVRVVLRTDRDMEYVHLKDHRGSGTEPVNVLSRYKYQDGLGYYESTRDTASHFFIDYLPKGVYVFEYSTRVQLRGKYETGIANIQCMYAPEFNSHSESLPIEVN